MTCAAMAGQRRCAGEAPAGALLQEGALVLARLHDLCLHVLSKLLLGVPSAASGQPFVWGERRAPALEPPVQDGVVSTQNGHQIEPARGDVRDEAHIGLKRREWKQCGLIQARYAIRTLSTVDPERSRTAISSGLSYRLLSWAPSEPRHAPSCNALPPRRKAHTAPAIRSHTESRSPPSRRNTTSARVCASASAPALREEVGAVKVEDDAARLHRVLELVAHLTVHRASIMVVGIKRGCAVCGIASSSWTWRWWRSRREGRRRHTRSSSKMWHSNSSSHPWCSCEAMQRRKPAMTRFGPKLKLRMPRLARARAESIWQKHTCFSRTSVPTSMCFS
eukprot:3770230-Pleurochrysis_carterae.AAC.5